MNVTTLYTKYTTGRGNKYSVQSIRNFYNDTLPILKRLLGKAPRLILQENSFQFNKRNYSQTHGTAMGTKMAVAFANIFMGEIEKRILNESAHKPLAWKRYIDDRPAEMASKSSLSKQINTIQQSNLRLTCHVRCDFLRVTTIHKGQRFKRVSSRYMRTHFNPPETFQYTFYTTCHPPGAKKGFIKGEGLLRFLRTNSSNKTFEENITTFKKHLMKSGYP